jgi:hypothetical protein
VGLRSPLKESCTEINHRVGRAISRSSSLIASEPAFIARSVGGINPLNFRIHQLAFEVVTSQPSVKKYDLLTQACRQHSELLEPPHVQYILSLTELLVSRRQYYLDHECAWSTLLKGKDDLRSKVTSAQLICTMRSSMSRYGRACSNDVTGPCCKACNARTY